MDTYSFVSSEDLCEELVEDPIYDIYDDDVYTVDFIFCDGALERLHVPMKTFMLIEDGDCMYVHIQNVLEV